MYAVIRAGGKQYRVAPGDVIRIEKTQAEKSGHLEFTDVLAVSAEAGQIARPQGDSARVVGHIVEQGRADKILVFHFKRKKQYKKLAGHRQPFTAVRITEIAFDGHKFTAPELPAIVVNAKDAPRGRVFTLMHEFCHLMLNRGGVCDPARVGSEGRSPDENVEVFCNRMAGALLVPRDALLEDARVQAVRDTSEWEDELLGALASDFGVSREVILRRLLILGKTTGEFYEQKRAEYLAQYAERATGVQENGGFAPPFRVALRDNGRRYTSLVLEALERERITPADVTDFLGVRLKHLHQMAEAVRQSVAEVHGVWGSLEGLGYGD